LGTSVGANFHEASRARSRAEYRSEIAICLGEASETEFWLKLLAAEPIIEPEKLEHLTKECGELVAILTTIHKKLK
jgi:four helix bundle protein